ncbi:MAG: response regulator [Desulfobacteraceae bacterium]
MSDFDPNNEHMSAREKFLGLSLESTRKSYYPQLMDQLKTAKESQRRLQLLMDNLPVRIAYVDSNQCYGFVNQAYEKAFNLSRENISGRSVKEIMGRDNYARMKPYINDALSGRPIRYEGEFLGPDGRNTWLEVNFLPDIDTGGNVLGFYDLTHDLTDRKQAEEKLRQNEKQLQQTQKIEAIGTLAGGIAHDFNNILSGIFGFSQLAKSHINNPEKAAECMDQVMGAAQKAADLVQQILTFSRKSEHQKYPLHMHGLIKEALKLIRSSIPATIEIKESVNTDAKILADPTNIHQVIMNLCTNGYHAMEETGGTLTVNLSKTEVSRPDFPAGSGPSPGNYLVLEISDTGEGIHPDIMEKIFEPYFTTKGKGKGTGLGLAMVMGIVKDHNGHITVDSRVGKGTRFKLYFPVVEEGLEHSSSGGERENDIKRGDEHLLMVDDEETILTSAKALLADYGYTVATFTDPASAFEIFENAPLRFDLVITDMTMPHMTGVEFAHRILALKPDLPIILCTGHHDRVNRETALAEGFSEFLEKPVLTEKLVRVIRRLLDSRIPL